MHTINPNPFDYLFAPRPGVLPGADVGQLFRFLRERLDLVREWWAARAKVRKDRAARAVLLALPEHLQRDIGIGPSAGLNARAGALTANGRLL
ncbi:MAG: hypothetical protein QNJ20_05140 [Paracoccaceae bacterium]|nr:hypothetical protein [Paracoccaceae bacterium]